MQNYSKFSIATDVELKVCNHKRKHIFYPEFNNFFVIYN